MDERVLGRGLTAVFTAKMRELETNRDRPAIVDHLAGVFVEATGLDYSMVQLSDLTGERLFESNVIRTWWIDRRVERAIAEGCRQAVIVGAGLDSRAFRLDEVSVRWFEVESGPMSEFKRDVLQATGRLRRREKSWVQLLVAEIGEASWYDDLAKNGFDAAVPTCWIVEGMFYLTEGEGRAALAAMAQLSAPGSHCVVAHFGPASLKETQTREMASEARAQSGRSFSSTVDDPNAWLGSAGWSLAVSETIAEAGMAIDRHVIYSTPEETGHEYTWLIDGIRN